MKTTKKGFTLIELIVVIAIIGVLAAILVPAMLGYVKKSKIQAANSAAKTIMNSANSALTELDEATDATRPDDGCWSHAKDAATLTGGTGTRAGDLYSYMTYYQDALSKVIFAVQVKDGVCVMAAAQSGKYYGTNPAYYTNRNYTDPGSCAGAITAVNGHLNVFS